METKRNAMLLIIVTLEVKTINDQRFSFTSTSSKIYIYAATFALILSNELKMWPLKWMMSTKWINYDAYTYLYSYIYSHKVTNMMND